MAGNRNSCASTAVAPRLGEPYDGFVDAVQAEVDSQSPQMIAGTFDSSLAWPGCGSNIGRVPMARRWNAPSQGRRPEQGPASVTPRF